MNDFQMLILAGGLIILTGLCVGWVLYVRWITERLIRKLAGEK